MKHDVSWQDDALCADRGVGHWFFPPEDTRVDVLDIRPFMLCWQCPAEVACLAYARALKCLGIWGGVYRRRVKGTIREHTPERPVTVRKTARDAA